MKRRPMSGKKYLHRICNKGPVSKYINRSYNLISNKNNNNNNNNKKQAEDLKIYFSKEDIEIANRNIEKVFNDDNY